MATGLIMEGGAMRGMYTAGIIDVLMENGIVFDGSIGVSAGACFGINYKSNQIGRSIRYNKKYCNDKRYCSVRSLIKTGDMFGADFCYREIPYELDKFDFETFQNSPMTFYAVATDIETGKAVYKKIDKCSEKDLQWIRASASMPLVSKVVEIDGRKFLDGGIADSIPLRAFEKLGYNKNVVILTRPRNYQKKKNSVMPFIKVAFKDYPELVKAMDNRHKMYNKQTKYVYDRESEGDVFVFAPDEPLPIGRIEHDPNALELVYNIGREQANARLLELKRFLESD
ncbi:MAG: patatin family protein [Oscillospiraceae bacterium]|nr:patatin family protein [Oscillospiraceae bacterium]